jgi:hypothetical protein
MNLQARYNLEVETDRLKNRLERGTSICGVVIPYS